MKGTYYGYLGADSLVKMEDGSEKRIDALMVGQKVQINESGQLLTIVDIVKGQEEKPCLRITTANGSCLLVTGEYPILIHDRICLANKLIVGDLIRTESGTETVRRIEKEEYDGTVYNLILGDADGPASSGVAYYANGILVGEGNLEG